MKRCKEANNRHHNDLLLVNLVAESTTQDKFVSLRSSGGFYLENTIRLIARNCIYVCFCYNIKIHHSGRYFYDLFRLRSGYSLMPVVNLINATGVDASLIFNHDLITEAVESNLVVPGFNPNTYKLAFDLWEYSK